jgi:anti-anti-sigma regulatory factor
MLEVHEVIDGEGRDVFVLCGDLTAECATLLQRTLAAACRSDDGPVLDLRGVPEVDERGAEVLSSIASWWEANSRPLRIDHPSPQLRAALTRHGTSIAEL